MSKSGRSGRVETKSERNATALQSHETETKATKKRSLTKRDLRKIRELTEHCKDRWINVYFPLHVSRSAFMRFLAKLDPIVKQGLYDLKRESLAETVDVVETKLEAAIKAGHPWAIKYYLDAKGKDRGYGRQSVEVEANISLADLLANEDPEPDEGDAQSNRKSEAKSR